MDSTTNPKGENNIRIKNWGTFLGLQHFGGKGACWKSVIHIDLHKSNNKLVSALLEHFWMWGSIPHILLHSREHEM
jgi:hypothetical protein